MTFYVLTIESFFGCNIQTWAKIFTVPRKLVLLKFEKKEKRMILMKASANWIIMFLFTIPHEVVCIHFTYFLGTGNLRNNSLLANTISMVCTIPCQRLFVPDLIFIGVVLERSLENRRQTADQWRVHFLMKLHEELCLIACLNKIKILIGKHFFRYFKENLSTHLTHFSPVWPFM